MPAGTSAPPPGRRGGRTGRTHPFARRTGQPSRAGLSTRSSLAFLAGGAGGALNASGTLRGGERGGSGVSGRAVRLSRGCAERRWLRGALTGSPLAPVSPLLPGAPGSPWERGGETLRTAWVGAGGGAEPPHPRRWQLTVPWGRGDDPTWGGAPTDQRMEPSHSRRLSAPSPSQRRREGLRPHRRVGGGWGGGVGCGGTHAVPFGSGGTAGTLGSGGTASTREAGGTGDAGSALRDRERGGEAAGTPAPKATCGSTAPHRPLTVAPLAPG